MSVDNCDESEDELVERAKQLDQLSLQQLLFQHYSGWLRRITRKLPASIATAISPEDVLQETFTKVYRGVGSFRGCTQPSFIAWVNRIADNEVKDQMKKWQARMRGGHHARIDDQSLSKLAATLSRGGQTPSHEVRTAESAQAVRIAIGSLPKHYQQVIFGRMRGESWAEIAKNLEKRIPAARGIYVRAIDQLRDELGRMSAYLSSQ